MLSAPAGVLNANPQSFLRFQRLGLTDEEKMLIREDVFDALRAREWNHDQIMAYKCFSVKIDAQTSLTTFEDFLNDPLNFKQGESKELLRKNKDLESWVVVTFLEKYRELYPNLTWGQLEAPCDFPSFDSEFFEGTTRPSKAGGRPKYERGLAERDSLVGFFVGLLLLYKIGIRGRSVEFVFDVVPRLVHSVDTIYSPGKTKSLKRVNREKLFRLINSNVEGQTDTEDAESYVPASQHPVALTSSVSPTASSSALMCSTVLPVPSSFALPESEALYGCGKKKRAIEMDDEFHNLCASISDPVNSVDMDSNKVPLIGNSLFVTQASNKRCCVGSSSRRPHNSSSGNSSHTVATDAANFLSARVIHLEEYISVDAFGISSPTTFLPADCCMSDDEVGFEDDFQVVSRAHAATSGMLGQSDPPNTLEKETFADSFLGGSFLDAFEEGRLEDLSVDLICANRPTFSPNTAAIYNEIGPYSIINYYQGYENNNAPYRD